MNERGRSGTSRDSNPASHWSTKCNVGLMSQKYHGPKCRSGHVCQNIAWTRPWGLVLYKECRGGQKSSSPNRGWPNRSWGPFGLESAIGFDTPSDTNARRPSQKAGGVSSYISSNWIIPNSSSWGDIYIYIYGRFWWIRQDDKDHWKKWKSG